MANEIMGSDAKPLALRDVVSHRYFLYAISLAVFFLAWDFVAKYWAVSSALVPPSEVAGQLYKMFSGTRFVGMTLFQHIMDSARRVLIGFMIAVGIGMPLGFAMSFSSTADAVLKPIFDLFKPMPPIAWISMSILWFGIGEFSKVFIIVIGCLPVCIISTFNATQLVEPRLCDIIRVLGGNRRAEIVHVYLPASLPAIFSGAQVALSSAWTCVLAAELLSSRSGIGFLIKRGMDTQQTALVIGGMIVIAFLSCSMSALINLLERLLCPWQQDINNF